MEACPEISAVIAAYNHGRYIGETIRSVLNQTFGDFEVIVFDDGSMDETKRVVSAFTDKRIRYFRQPNSGLPASGRNRAMSLARGRYIALLDGDDWWREDKLEKCLKAMEERPGVSLVYHNEAVVYNGKTLRITSFGPLADEMYSKLLFTGNCLHSSAVMIRRKVFFDDSCRFSEDRGLFTVEDYEYWMRLAKRYRFYFLDEPLTYYRVTETGAFLRSAEAAGVNMLRLLDSHFDKIGSKSAEVKARIGRRRSAVMCAAGRMFHHNREFARSREWYLKAIGENPSNYKAYVGLAAALAGVRIIYR